MAVGSLSLEVLEVDQPGRFGPVHEPENVFKEGLVAAGDGERAGVRKSELLLGLGQELLEEGVVEEGGPDYEALVVWSDADGHVAGRDVGGEAALGGGRGGFVPPPPQHLP